MQVIKKGFVKAIVRVLLSLFLLLALLVGSVQFPFIQTKLVNYFTKELSLLTGFDIYLEKIDIDWFDQISITGLKVTDPEGNRLFYTQYAVIDFDLSSLLNQENRNIDEVEVENATLYFTNIMSEDSTYILNISELVQRIRKSIKRTSTGKGELLTVDEIKLRNVALTYYYQTDSVQTMREGLDYKHFSIERIYGDFEDFRTKADTLEVKIVTLSAKEYLSGLTINNLKSNFHLSQRSMRFEEMALEVGNSYITNKVIFNYSSTQDLSDFVNKVTIEASLKNTTINTRDLALFAPQMKAYRDRYKVTGDFNGKVNGFILKNASVNLGNGSTFNGKIRMTGLPDFQETFIDFDLANSTLKIADFQKYISEKTYRRIEPFSQINLTASFLGFPNDFVARGDFTTIYGKIESDINLKIQPDINQSTYSGKLKLTGFDIGGYTQNKLLGPVTMSGEIEGSGVNIDRADFKLNGHIDNIAINNYVYSDITTDARFSKELFEGFLEINDPNLKLSTNGSIDLRKGVNLFNINAQIDTANLQQLNLSNEHFLLSSQVQINAQGLKIDDFVGEANLLNLYLKYQDNDLHLDTLKVVSTKTEAIRELSLLTNLVDVKAKGSFDYTQLYKDLNTLVYEYRLNLKNNKDSLDQYYATKKIEVNPDYSVSYAINLKDANPLFDLFLPSVQLGKNVRIDGEFTGGYTSILSINSQPDTIRYNDNVFAEDEFQINISKVADSTDVLALIYFASKEQTISGVQTKDLFLEGIWNKNHIDFEFDIDQVKYNNYARLYGTIDFLPFETVIHLNPSDLKILDKNWTIDSQNQITIKPDDTSIQDLSISSEGQNVAVNGFISRDPDKVLDITIDQVKLENLNTIFTEDLAGTVNGSASIRDYYHNLSIQSLLTIDDFRIDKFLVGDIDGSNIWNNLENNFKTNFVVNRLGKRIVDIHGTYSPNLASPLDLTANLNETELKIVEPFVDSYFTSIRGTASGKLQIKGGLNKPIIEGNGQIRDAGLLINYLNTSYTFNGGFYFKESTIGFENIIIHDTRNGQAQMAGSFSHTNFKDFSINIGGDFEDLLLLNTTSNDNTLFYGTGVGSGRVDFVGPISNMNIIARATTRKDTRIYIPIGESENIQQEDYINFVNFSDSSSLDVNNEIDKVDLKGLKLDFDLDITPDAYTEIIFDIKSGDIIRGRGRGDIKLQIDTKGEFNMFGDFAIEEGGYNFTLYNIINKEFEILPDSKISWFGDPYEGLLNIKATYNQLASLLPLMVQQSSDTIYQQSPEIRRKYPVKVLLGINGPLLSPDVNFDIQSDKLPRNVLLPNGEVKDLEFEFLAFKNRIDEQELKRQVFSLIILRKFSPLQSFNTGGSITSSVSELFSNQLSYWITQVDENLEIDVDLGQLDEEAFNTFQLRLSYTFLDGRLRITRDGGFTNQANKADISSIAGDWTLEYLLTQDGKFKVKMYNRTNYNPINPNQDNQNTITTGFSIIHTQSFDELKDLFKKSRDKGKKDKQKQETEEEDGTEDVILQKAVLRDDDETE